jgi:hypothetical protein
VFALPVNLPHYLALQQCTLNAVRTIALTIVMEQYIISNTTGTSRNTKDASRVPPKTSAQTPSAAESISTKIEQDEDLQKWRKSVNRNGGETNANISTLIFCHFEALWDDFSSWARLYGLGGAIIMVIFGKKSIWKTQLEVLHSSQLGGLGSPGSGSRIGGSGDPGGDPLPGVGGGGGGNGPGGDGDPGWPDSDYICDQAAQEFKNLVQVESTRISLSVRFSNCKFYERKINMEKGYYRCRHCHSRYNSP